ncbi:MAG: sugar ABC transporter permease [Clostridiaceae bacterium]|nr:sugar ABC transporter permease [Clostridiales bacterium]MDD6878484.1 sugar ABC transporter permease [Clostridiaceae bacterium]MDY3072518.1 sugar ABC transporter permease [Eubacteriales bacterium]MDY3287186.1 sugar ABC transporter permease [Eubacteriales bacterium]MDY5014778.1 sugar ABC transporter permease [Eubacteriales bacterium]
MKAIDSTKPKKRRFRIRLAQKEGLVGLVFMIPWIIGFIFFFAKPLVTSLIYSFHEVKFVKEGVALTFVGLRNYRNALTADAALLKAFPGLLAEAAFQVPVVALYSLLIALLLNQKFAGRTAFRTIFFLPVIIASPIIMSLLTQTGMDTEVAASSNVFIFASDGMEAVLAAIMGQYGLPADIIEKLTSVTNNIFQVSWRSGIPIVLYLSNLQTIPASYNEVAMIEGATKWEYFWKITFPLVSPIMLVCLVYTVVDSFTDSTNTVMQIIQNNLLTKMHYSATVSWLYFMLILIILGIIFRLFAKRVYYMS